MSLMTWTPEREQDTLTYYRQVVGWRGLDQALLMINNRTLHCDVKIIEEQRLITWGETRLKTDSVEVVEHREKFIEISEFALAFYQAQLEAFGRIARLISQTEVR